MALEGFDFAWTKPTPSEVKNLGGHWIAGYLSPDQSKNLTRGQVAGFLADGIGVVVVWESSAGRALQGRAAGVADAHAAEAQRAALGLPADMVIHFAVDTDTDWASVQSYFDGAASVIGMARTGCYGGVRVIEGAHGHGIRFLWQTVAWSGGVWSPHATIRQPGGTVMSGGLDIDDAEVPDFGQAPRPTTGGIPMPLDPQTQTQIRTIVDQALAAARGTAVNDSLWWWQQVMDGTVPKGTPPVIANAITDIHAHLAAMAEKPDVPVPPVVPVPPAKK